MSLGENTENLGKFLSKPQIFVATGGCQIQLDSSKLVPYGSGVGGKMGALNSPQYIMDNFLIKADSIFAPDVTHSFIQ